MASNLAKNTIPQRSPNYVILRNWNQYNADLRLVTATFENDLN